MSSPLANQTKKAVITDEDSNFRAEAQRMFRENAIEPIADFGSAYELLAFLKVRGREVDYLLLSLELPAIDGYELLTKITSENPNIAIIATADPKYSQAKHVVQAFRCGAKSFIAKPLYMSTFTKAVTDIIFDIFADGKKNRLRDLLVSTASRMSIGLAIIGTENNVVWKNRMFSEITGFDIDLPSLHIIFQEDGPIKEFVYSKGDLLEPSQGILTRRDSRKRYVEAEAYPINYSMEKYVVFQLSDITRHKEAEKAVLEEVKQLQAFKSSIPVGVMNVNSSGDVSYINDKVLTILGSKPQIGEKLKCSTIINQPFCETCILNRTNNQENLYNFFVSPNGSLAVLLICAGHDPNNKKADRSIFIIDVTTIHQNYQKEARSQESTIVSLTKQRDAFKEDIELLRAKIGEYEEKIRILVKEETLHSQNISTMKTEYEANKAALAALERDMADISGELTKYEKKIEITENNLKISEREKQDLMKSIIKEQSKVVTHEAVISSLEKDKNSLLEELKSYREQLEAQKSSISAITTEKQKLMDEIGILSQSTTEKRSFQEILESFFQQYTNTTKNTEIEAKIDSTLPQDASLPLRSAKKGKRVSKKVSTAVESVPESSPPQQVKSNVDVTSHFKRLLNKLFEYAADFDQYNTKEAQIIHTMIVFERMITIFRDLSNMDMTYKLLMLLCENETLSIDQLAKTTGLNANVIKLNLRNLARFKIVTFINDENVSIVNK